jgi:hypothetical protein
MGSNVYFYHKKKLGQKIGEAVSKGFNAKTRQFNGKIFPGDTIIHGLLGRCDDLVKQCISSSRDFLFVDHSFFMQQRGKYYRTIKNSRDWHETGDMPDDRWKKLDLELKPWKKNGSNIVVIEVPINSADILGIDPGKWLKDTMSTLSENSDRKIIVKERFKLLNNKKVRRPLSDFLTDAHALVTFDSNSTIEAVIAGVPIFCGIRNPVHSIAESNFAKIETPIYPDREQCLQNLAYQQFTIDEIASGFAKEILYGG